MLLGVLVIEAPGLEARILQGRDRAISHQGNEKEARGQEWYQKRFSPPSSVNSRRTNLL